MHALNDWFATIDGYIGGSAWFVYLLLGAGLFFTLYLKFPQVRYFRHAFLMVTGKYDEKGKLIPAAMELVRLAIPRRMYTQAHMDVVAESVANVYDRRDSIKGLKLVYEPEYLRFFQARFEPVE